VQKGTTVAVFLLIAACLTIGQSEPPDKKNEHAALLRAQSPTSSLMPVSADNFNRAESDMYFAGNVKNGGFGKFNHNREVMPIDKQAVIRANRDTLYSAAVFDLDAGPVTITMPDAGKRFMSMMVIDEDQYVPFVFYGAGAHTFTKEQVGTRYVLVGIRTFADPSNPKDLEQVHSLQDAIKVSQANSGSFETPNWDPVSQKKVRDALLVLAATLPDTKRMFGARDQVDPVRHLIGTATGWGGNPEKDAIYLTVVPSKNDGTTVYKLICRKTGTTPIRSTTSPQTRAQTDQWPSSSVAVTAGFPTVCPPFRAGAIGCASIVRVLRF